MGVEWVRKHGIVFNDNGTIRLNMNAAKDETYVPWLYDSLVRICKVYGEPFPALKDINMAHITLAGISAWDAVMCATKLGWTWTSMWDYAKKEVLAATLLHIESAHRIEDLPIQALELIGVKKRLVNAFLRADCVKFSDLFERNEDGVNPKLLRIKTTSVCTLNTFCTFMIPYTNMDQMCTLRATFDKIEEMRNRRVAI